MTEQRNLEFTGRLKPGATAEQAVAALVSRFNLPGNKARALVVGARPVVVKRGLEAGQAERLAVALEQAGLAMRLVVAAPPSDAATSPPPPLRPTPRPLSTGAALAAAGPARHMARRDAALKRARPGRRRGGNGALGVAVATGLVGIVVGAAIVALQPGPEVPAAQAGSGPAVASGGLQSPHPRDAHPTALRQAGWDGSPIARDGRPAADSPLPDDGATAGGQLPFDAEALARGAAEPAMPPAAVPGRLEGLMRPAGSEPVQDSLYTERLDDLPPDIRELYERQRRLRELSSRRGQ